LWAQLAVGISGLSIPPILSLSVFKGASKRHVRAVLIVSPSGT